MSNSLLKMAMTGVGELLKLLPLISIAAVFSCCSVTAKKCPSFCTAGPEDCTSKGGRVVGYCTNNAACCDLTDSKVTGRTCGESVGNESSVHYFQSPHFPAFGTNDLICSFSFKLQDDTVGIMLDFLEFSTDGVKYGSISPNHVCDADMFFIKGFNSWNPPSICGRLTKYQMVIDDAKLENVEQITLHAVMSSSAHRWNIKITQIQGKDWPDEKPESATPENEEQLQNSTTTEKIFTRDAYGEVTSSKENKKFEEFHDPHKPNPVAATSNDQPEVRPEITPLVVNGIDTPLGKAPWQASLRINLVKLRPFLEDNIKGHSKNRCDIYEGSHFCGGTIIGDQEILTAAHCFSPLGKAQDRLPLEVVSVVLGDSNKCRDSEKGNKTSRVNKSSMFKHKFRNPTAKAYEIKSVVLHYAYEPYVIMNDVAIVRLKKKIRFNDQVQPIPFAKSGEDFTGEKAFASGWGKTNVYDSKNTGSDILQSSDNFKIDSKKACKTLTLASFLDSESRILSHEKYKDIFSSTMCTTSANKSVETLVGQGDSGGPLVHFDEDTSRPVLIGIVSFGRHVKHQLFGTEGFVNYFQSVAYFRNWIDTALVALRSK